MSSVHCQGSSKNRSSVTATVVTSYVAVGLRPSSGSAIRQSQALDQLGVGQLRS